MNSSASQPLNTSTEAENHAVNGQMLFPDDRLIWRFSPNQTDPELLEAIFVGREPLLQNVLEKIHDSATSGATHHVLLWGPPGIGKSHFLSLLFHRMNKDEQLRSKVRIARLSEDETTTSMAQFLVRIYRSLGQAHPGEFSLAWLDDVLSQAHEDVADVLTRRLAARFDKRRLVILVENLDRLFEGLGAEGQHHLRTLLQETPFACLVATSLRPFKAVTDRGEPFFGFFQPIQLRPMSLQEAQNLLARIAMVKGQQDLVAYLATPGGLGRVHAIYDVAGGIHRIYIMLSRFISLTSLEQLVVPFQQMMDDLTPFYQGRLYAISPLQRQIVELLCSENQTLNPKEIARRLLLTEQSIGKQVRNLVELGYVTAEKKGRETFYDLSDPLMRLTYELKETSLLVRLIEFLRLWYSDDQQESPNITQTNALHEYASPATKISTLSNSPQTALDDDLELAEAQSYLPAIARAVDANVTTLSSAGAWCLAGEYFARVSRNFEKAERCFENALQLDADYVPALWGRGEVLFNRHRWDEGFECLRNAVLHGQQDSEHLNNIAAVFGFIFRLSEDNQQLETRLNKLFDIYEETALLSPPRPTQTGTNWKSARPLLPLAAGLVRSLGRINAERVNAGVLQSYSDAVQRRATGHSDFEIALRLFRYGIRYLIKNSEADFAELIQPERNILRQALGLLTGKP